MLDVRCGDCHFYCEIHFGAYPVRYECHRFPPQTRWQPDGHNQEPCWITRWSRTYHDQIGCGEFVDESSK